MNPYLEAGWGDVHTMLIGYIRDALSAELPPDLAARGGAHYSRKRSKKRKARSRRVDVAVVESWREGFPPVWEPGGGAASLVTLVDQPLVFLEDAEPERSIEIRDSAGRLITVIEVLSPANKREGWAEYRSRQRDFLSAGVALVEIDLIRGGWHTAAIGSDHLPPAGGTRYLVCLARPQPGIRRREVYLAPLRQRLPVIRVPLRLGDPDAPLALAAAPGPLLRNGPLLADGVSPPSRPAAPARGVSLGRRAPPGRRLRNSSHRLKRNDCGWL